MTRGILYYPSEKLPCVLMGLLLISPHLHDVDGHSLGLHPVHGVHQPVDHLGTDEAGRREALLFRQQLDACAEARQDE